MSVTLNEYLNSLNKAEMRNDVNYAQGGIGAVFRNNFEHLAKNSHLSEKEIAEELIADASIFMKRYPQHFDSTWIKNTLNNLNDIKNLLSVLIIGTIIGLSAWALSGNASPKA